MFRLPIPNYRIRAGCNFAIAQSLLAVISGLSVTLYSRSGKSGERFKGMLIDHFPWSDEPANALKGVSAAEAVYSVFRNPLTHDLGPRCGEKGRDRLSQDKTLRPSSGKTRADGTGRRTPRELDVPSINVRNGNGEVWFACVARRRALLGCTSHD
jgi:hypothetical protein